MSTEHKNLDTTTKQAIVLVSWYVWVIIRNTARAINRIVCRHPWVCIIITMIVAVVVSFIQISKARAERDSYNKALVSTQMQLDNYKAVYVDTGKEVR